MYTHYWGNSRRNVHAIMPASVYAATIHLDRHTHTHTQLGRFYLLEANPEWNPLQQTCEPPIDVVLNGCCKQTNGTPHSRIGPK